MQKKRTRNQTKPKTQKPKNMKPNFLTDFVFWFFAQQCKTWRFFNMFKKIYIKNFKHSRFLKQFCKQALVLVRVVSS